MTKNIVKCKHIWKCFKYSWSLYFQFRKKSANTVRKMLQKELPTKIRRYETRPAERKMLEMFTYCACVSYLERLKVLWNGNGGRDFSEWVASWLAGRLGIPGWRQGRVSGQTDVFAETLNRFYHPEVLVRFSSIRSYY